MEYSEKIFKKEEQSINQFFERVKLIRTVARREIIERLELTTDLRIKADELLQKMDAEDEEKFC